MEGTITGVILNRLYGGQHETPGRSSLQLILNRLYGGQRRCLCSVLPYGILNRLYGGQPGRNRCGD